MGSTSDKELWFNYNWADGDSKPYPRWILNNHNIYMEKVFIIKHL